MPAAAPPTTSSAGTGYPDRRVRDGPSPSAAELVPVAPGGELAANGRADPDDLELVTDPGEADVVGRNPQPGVPEQALAVFDRLPPLLERGEIPAFAPTAYDPQPAAVPVERDPASDRKRLEDFVMAEGPIAEQTGRVHRRHLYLLPFHPYTGTFWRVRSRNRPCVERPRRVPIGIAGRVGTIGIFNLAQVRMLQEPVLRGNRTPQEQVDPDRWHDC